MPQLNDLASSLKDNHREVSGMISSFQNALAASDLKKAKEILCSIEEATSGHFRFEAHYLYPRMRRLMFKMIEKLGEEQDKIKGSIKQSKDMLNKDRITKDRLPGISEMLSSVSKYLEDCNDLVVMVNKFDKEELLDLNKKFEECCAVKK